MGEVGLVLVPIGAGVGAAKAAGFSVKILRYPNAGGGGINVMKNGARHYALDWHRFKSSSGQWMNRIHEHWGATKSQMKKHRSIITGKPY